MERTVNERYRHLLRLKVPWKLTSAEKDLSKEIVTVYFRWPGRAAVGCRQRGKACGVHERLPKRITRHLSVMQYTLELRRSLPRCKYPEHGVNAVRVPQGAPVSRFKLQFESFEEAVIAASRSLTQAAGLLRLNWDSAQRLFDRAVARGLPRGSTTGLQRVGLDEKSFLGGQRYVSLITDLQQSRVLEGVEGRDAAQTMALWAALPPEQHVLVDAAAMDMGANFVAATRQGAPQAAVVHDRFHVAEHLNEAVDRSRREESARLAARGDKSLRKTRYLWPLASGCRARSRTGIRPALANSWR
jgi:transposase